MTKEEYYKKECNRLYPDYPEPNDADILMRLRRNAMFEGLLKGEELAKEFALWIWSTNWFPYTNTLYMNNVTLEEITHDQLFDLFIESKTP